MIITGKYYSTLTGDENGNNKYTVELKSSIEKAGKLCLENINNKTFSPIMMMGNIQSGKTRGFIGLMSLCFDNGFDVTIILTKCSTALVKQTVSRMMTEFAVFRTGNATVGDIVAQDILDIDFRSCDTMGQKEAVIKKFLKNYKRKKRIIVVKKQADNVDRLNLFIEAIVKYDYYQRLLIVDDEADITSVGYEKSGVENSLSLRRISGSINTMRKSLHSNIEHVLMQVTATPYALYLQPENFSNNNIMPIKPSRTVVLPTGNGYIGGEYYFIDSEDEESTNYCKAKYLPHIVPQEEMSVLNGNRKNSGKNPVITDGRTVKIDEFLSEKKGRASFALPSLRNWIFDILVGTAIVQLTQGNEDFYLSAVLHAAINKQLHHKQKELIESCFEVLVSTLEKDINNPDFREFVKISYIDMIESVKAYGTLRIPTLDEVINRIAVKDDDGELEGLINEVDLKEVNSDNDITTLLNISTGELKLENSLTIFVGGQVLDRGITIPNMISFFYGRDPKTMQQDTVMQHCRMFGYRNNSLLSVTRLYTTYRLFSSMKEITIRDNLLRDRMLRQTNGEVVYLEAGGKIKACSPQKILASEVNTILPEKRYLPVGFDVDKQNSQKAWREIDRIIRQNNGYLPSEYCSFIDGQSLDDLYVKISSEDAFNILKAAYSVIIPKEDGKCNKFKEIESVFLFSLSEREESGADEIALIVRTDRKLTKMKRNGTMYQDSPDDGKNEGAIAKILRSKMPVLVLTEQTHHEWGRKFWWPVYYTPDSMNIGIYSEARVKTGILENVSNASVLPMYISEYNVIDNIGLNSGITEKMKNAVDRILTFYDDNFKVNRISNTVNRKEFKCPVYIESYENFPQTEDLVQYTARALQRISNILGKSPEVENIVCQISEYFHSLIKGETNDKKREYLLDLIDSFNTTKVNKESVKGLINEAEMQACESRDTFGLFTIFGSGICDIHLNIDAIRKYCKEKDYYGESIEIFMQYVLSHEIFHSIHYADTMTESGRWIYTRKDFFKQQAVKETLAEYFALCYSKYAIPKSVGEFDIVDCIRQMRGKDKFPDDGGYSGALIIEKRDKTTFYGKDNDMYADVYSRTLSDMPDAFYKIKKADNNTGK